MATDDDVHISLPPSLFAGIILSAVLGGGGLYGVFGPQMDKAAITQCIDNSDIAINQADLHGREIQILRELIYERTQDRYTAEDARKDWGDQIRRDSLQDRRIENVEEEME